jgi:hypothetical protein
VRGQSSSGPLEAGGRADPVTLAMVGLAIAKRALCAAPGQHRIGANSEYAADMCSPPCRVPASRPSSVLRWEPMRSPTSARFRIGPGIRDLPQVAVSPTGSLFSVENCLFQSAGNSNETSRNAGHWARPIGDMDPGVLPKNMILPVFSLQNRECLEARNASPSPRRPNWRATREASAKLCGRWWTRRTAMAGRRERDGRSGD